MVIHKIPALIIRTPATKKIVFIFLFVGGGFRVLNYLHVFVRVF